MKEVGPSILNSEPETIDATTDICYMVESAVDTNLVEGLDVAAEQDNSTALAECPASIIGKQQSVPSCANLALNTYTRRYQKGTNEGNQMNDRALVVWVEGAKEGAVNSDAAEIGREEGPSKWVFQKIVEFSKMVGVSCDGYEDRLLQLFEELEASRG